MILTLISLIIGLILFMLFIKFTYPFWTWLLDYIRRPPGRYYYDDYIWLGVPRRQLGHHAEEDYVDYQQQPNVPWRRTTTRRVPKPRLVTNGEEEY